MTITPQDIAQAILLLAPNADFSFQGEDLSTLKWNDSSVPRPTDEEILAQVPLVQAEQVKVEQSILDTKASGMAHALSLGFTQAQAEAMFP